MKLLWIIFLGFLLSHISCNNSEKENREFSLFTEVKGIDSGINFSNNLHYSSDLNIIEYLYYYNGGGVAIGDINNDGLEDIYFGANQSPDRLYLNMGDLKFKDISELAGLQMDSTWSTGVTMDDINGDGFMDIYVCKVGVIGKRPAHNLLYINNGEGIFDERSSDYNLNFSGYSTQGSFFDYDLDGDLDMYLLNHSTHSVRSYGDTTKRSVRDDLSGDILFENRTHEEEGTFVEVTEQAGIYNSALGYGLSVITSDINNDGFTDIYVGNDFHENDYLYLNNGDKTFTESVTKTFHHTSQFSMGADIADMNNDGALDLFTTDMMPLDGKLLLKSGGEDSEQIAQIKKELGFENQYARNHFHLNNGDNTFSEIAYLTNTQATDWSWSVLLQDFNNNGNNDIFITNGIVKRPNDLDYINFINQVDLNRVKPEQKDLIYNDVISKMPTLKISNVLFINDWINDLQPLKRSYVGSPSFSNGAAYSDLDLDGDLDLVINNINDASIILENNSSGHSNYVSFSLKTSEGKESCKGAKVSVFVNDNVYVKEYTTTKGFESSSTHSLHFGLGKYNIIDSVRVIWPGKKVQILKDVGINQHHNIIRQGERLKLKMMPKLESQEYTLNLLPYKHNENAYLDYNSDKLIPEKLSHEGPAVALDDFNGDGLIDIFIGGSVYQQPLLYLAETNGSYTPKEIVDFKNDSEYEDVDVVSFDFDQDGDLDLYVVSGGNDKKELDKLLQDRLYLNDGSGNFKRLDISLPHTNGGVVAAGDYNADGYIDLFVGARSIPGSYGLSPYSFILLNSEGAYFELAFKNRFGMVTDATWRDVNEDQKLDLVMVGDWMPITVLLNIGDGDFKNYTTELGLAETDGLWNTVEIVDLNKDGHLDIIAGNAGENFKWQASGSFPVKLYLNDYDRNGQIDPIIFHTYFGENIPFASKDQLAESLPFIKKRFPDYESFSNVRSITDLTDVKDSEIMETKQIKELRSMIYLYDSGKYKGVPLMKQAQLSSIQDFYVDTTDVNNLKVKFVGNHHEFLKNLGATNSNSGGELSSFSNELSNFTTYKSLSLPFNLNARRIKAFDSNSFLIAVNNDYQYILKNK